MPNISYDDASANDLIRQIHNKRNSNDSNSTSFANTLETNIRTVFNSPYKFVYELLQNADDAQATHVQFAVHGSDLIISHDGDPFNPEDVNKICDNAKPQGDKTQDIKKTGYKGVGFKAVFCISNKVSIISPPFCFRFDETHWQQRDDAKYPWPIIPIWTDLNTLKDRLPNENRFRVHFLLEQIDVNKIMNEINFIFSSPEILLVLRYVQKITITHINRVLEKHMEPNTVLLKSSENESQSQRWSITKIPISVPDNVRKKLDYLSSAECPDKLKQARTVLLTFAARMQTNDTGQPSLACLNKARLYCYLPTQVQAGLPYLVNADFLLNQDRTRLLNNVWNKFLLRSIAKHQFDWLATLSKQWPTSSLNMLSSPKIHDVDQPLAETFTMGYTEGINTVPFIPSTTLSRLLKFNQARIDDTHFFQQQSVFRDPKLSDDEGELLVAYDICGLDKLKQLTVNEKKIARYDYKTLVKRIESYIRSVVATPQHVVILLQSLTRIDTDAQTQVDYLGLLSEKAILLTVDGNIRTPKECYLSSNMPRIAQQFKVSIVHTKIARCHTLSLWLQQRFHMTSLSRKELIRRTIVQWIELNKINADNTVDILRFIYKSVRSHVQLSPSDYHKLCKFPIIQRANNRLTALDSVLLLTENSTNPRDCLPISDEYIRKGDNLDAWRDLLINMGIRTEVSLTHVPSFTIKELKQYFSNHTELQGGFQAYYDYLRKQFRQHLHYETPRDKEKLTNFVSYDFLHLLGEDTQYTLFWKAVRQGSSHLKTPSIYNKELTRNNVSFEVPHYLVYYLTTYRCIKVKGKDNRKKVNQLFYPSSQNRILYQRLELPIADIPVSLTQDQAKCLGFKIELNLSQCLDLLDNTPKKPKHLNFIYRRVLSLQPFSSEQSTLFEEWHQKGQLLASDHSMQPIKNLQHFDLPNYTPPGPQWLHTVDMKDDEIIAFVALFKLPSASKQHFDFSDSQIDHELHQKINEFIAPYLPILAILENRASNQGNATTALEYILEKYLCIKIYRINRSVALAYGSKVYRQQNALYISGRWVDGLVRSAIAKKLTEHFALSATTAEYFKNIILTLESDIQPILKNFHIVKENYDWLLGFQQHYISSQSDLPSAMYVTGTTI